MRKTRSDKGQSRIARKERGAVGSISSDAEIKGALQRINAKIRTWNKTFNDETYSTILGNKMAEFRDITSAVIFNDASGKYETSSAKWQTNKLGVPQLAVTAENIAWFKSRIDAHDEAYDRSVDIAAAKHDSTPKKGRNLLEVLDKMRSANEEIQYVKNFMRDNPEDTVSGETIVSKKEYMTTHPDAKVTTKEVNAINKKRIMTELQARAEYEFDSTIKDVIQKLYDEGGHDELIARLGAHEKWTRELLEEVNDAVKIWDPNVEAELEKQNAMKL